MKLLLIVGLLLIVALALSVLSKQAKRGKASGEIRPKRPLTEREQVAYFRLTKALPECVVLSQVSFQAILTARDIGTRNTFDRKYADFVICTKAFDVVAIVEIDDASHRGRTAQDVSRDKLLTAAGYRVLRFAQVPDTAELLSALSPTSQPA